MICLTKQIEIEHEQKVTIRINKTPDKLDEFIEAFKNSRFLIFRVVYKVFYSIWLAFMISCDLV